MVGCCSLGHGAEITISVNVATGTRTVETLLGHGAIAEMSRTGFD
jgi:hypothetical protein